MAIWKVRRSPCSIEQSLRVKWTLSFGKRRSALHLTRSSRFLVFGVTDSAGKMTTCHYGAIVATEPRDAEVKDTCRLLGRRLAEWVAVVADGYKDQHPLNKPESRTL